MAVYPSPSISKIEEAFSDHGVKYVVHHKERSRDHWPSGLRSVTVHHTAGKNSADYLASSWSLPGANCVINNGAYNGSAVDGRAVILAWGSAFHSGDGGPWPGVAARNNLHLVSWGIEIESLGTKKDITPKQVETVGRMIAAFVDLGMPLNNVVRHADWTDGTGPLGNHPLSTNGRKIDTRKDLGYTTDFWTKNAEKYLVVDRTGVTNPAKPKPGSKWDGSVPYLDIIMASQDGNTRNKATWRLACRLADLGFFAGTPVDGQQAYPQRAIANWQKSKGYKATGLYGPVAHQKLFGA